MEPIRLLFITILEEQKQGGKMAKRKRLIDQIYNGAFENAEFTQSSKATFYSMGAILLLGFILSRNVKK